MEPITTAAIAGVAYAGLTTAIGGCVEGLTEKGLSFLTRQVTDRIGGFGGLPRNHDAARALRRAQLKALRHVLRRFDGADLPDWSDDPVNKPEIFIAEANGFVSDNLSLCVSITVTDELATALSEAMDGSLSQPGEAAAAERMAEARQAVEAAVLAELGEALGATEVPEDFAMRFRGEVEGFGPWFDAFSLYLAEELKADEKFRTIFTATKLSNLEGLAIDGNEIVRALDEKADAIAADLSIVRETVDRIADEQARQGTLIEQIAAKLGVGAGTDAFESRITELGETHGASRAELLGLLKEIVGGGVPAGQIDQAIAEARKSLKATRDEMERLRSLANEAPEIEPDLAAARAALENADMIELEGAQEAIRKAREHYLDVVSARRLRESGNLSRLYEGEAQIALARSRPLDAAHLFGEAADAAPREDADRRRELYHRQAKALHRHGTVFGGLDALREAVAVLTFKVLAPAPGEERHGYDYEIELLRVDILQTIAQRASGSEADAAYEQAQDILVKLMVDWPRDARPQQWARLANMRGILFRMQGDRHGTAESSWYGKAERDFEQAMEVYAEHDMDADRAVVQVNLANVLMANGDLLPGEKGRSLLLQAIEHYEGAIKHFSRDDDPANWATCQNNLGSANRSLGDAASGEERQAYYAEAERAFGAALEVRTREAMPKDWSTTTTNRAGLRFSQTSLLTDPAEVVEALKLAVAEFRSVLEIQTREAMPTLRARTLRALGIALQEIGDRVSGDDQAAVYQEASTAFSEAIGIYDANNMKVDAAAVRLHRGEVNDGLSRILADKSLAEMYLTDAIGDYRAVLDHHDADDGPEQQAAILRALGDALYRLAVEHLDRSIDDAYLKEALKQFEAALKIRTQEKSPLDWAQLKVDCAIAREALAGREDGAREEHARAALEAYGLARSEYTPDRGLENWSITQRGMARAMVLVAQCQVGSEGIETLEQAVTLCEEVVAKMTVKDHLAEHMRGQYQLAKILTTLAETQDEKGGKDFARAQKAMKAVIASAKGAGQDRDVAHGHFELGKIEVAHGRLTGKRKPVKAGLETLREASSLYDRLGEPDLSEEVDDVRRQAIEVYDAMPKGLFS